MKMEGRSTMRSFMLVSSKVSRAHPLMRVILSNIRETVLVEDSIAEPLKDITITGRSNTLL